MEYSRQRILEEYSDEVFHLFFRSDFVLGAYYNSPLRAEDSSPSFNIFESSNNRILLFKDWGGKTGNCIDFVMAKENCSFVEALQLINVQLTKKESVKISNTRVYKVDSEEDIKFFLNVDKFGKHTYTQTDIWYWEVLHKTPLPIVRKNRVYSVKEIRVNNNCFIVATHKSPIYVFVEVVDTKHYYTLYAPFRAEKKWLKNIRGVATKAIGGLHLLPGYGKELIITKSVKDRIILYNLGFNVVSTQGEDIDIDKEILDNLKERFTDVYVLYDNDYNKIVNVGKLMGDKYQKLWGVKRILIPEEVKATDVGELIQTMDKTILKKLINEEWKKS